LFAVPLKDEVRLLYGVALARPDHPPRLWSHPEAAREFHAQAVAFLIALVYSCTFREKQTRKVQGVDECIGLRQGPARATPNLTNL
jgi:hypothetical protein